MVSQPGPGTLPDHPTEFLDQIRGFWTSIRDLGPKNLTGDFGTIGTMSRRVQASRGILVTGGKTDCVPSFVTPSVLVYGLVTQALIALVTNPDSLWTRAGVYGPILGPCHS